MQGYFVTVLLQIKNCSTQIACEFYFSIPLTFVFHVLHGLRYRGFNSKQKDNSDAKSYKRAQANIF
jgi:hypothetical protein